MLREWRQDLSKLIIVKPETVVGGIVVRFQWFWTYKTCETFGKST